MPTREQNKAFFDTFGFIVFRELLTASEVDVIDAEFERAMVDAERVPTQSSLSRFLTDADTPSCCALATDERFALAAELLLGRKALAIHVAGNRYTEDTLWHCDNYSLNYEGVKFVLYLDALDHNSGALRLIPTSHNARWGESCMTHRTMDIFGVTAAEVPSWIFQSSPGDVLAFRHPLWHATCNGGNNRRLIDVNFYADPQSEDEIRSVQKQMARNHIPSMLRGRQMYPRHWREIDSPAHQYTIRRLGELGALDTPPGH